MKRMLVLVGVAGLFATLASVAVAGSGQGQPRQLTGKVTSVTARSITVRAPRASLTCAARAGLQLGTFKGKRATMSVPHVRRQARRVSRQGCVERQGSAEGRPGRTGAEPLEQERKRSIVELGRPG